MSGRRTDMKWPQKSHELIYLNEYLSGHKGKVIKNGWYKNSDLSSLTVLKLTAYRVL